MFHAENEQNIDEDRMWGATEGEANTEQKDKTDNYQDIQHTVKSSRIEKGIHFRPKTGFE